MRPEPSPCRIPGEVKDNLFPEVDDPDSPLPAFHLPCGVRLSFRIGDGEGVSQRHLEQWSCSVSDLAEIAGRNAFTYSQWRETGERIYEDVDGCWLSTVLDPAPTLEHNEVVGRHVLYIVDGTKAILTGDASPAGLARIREAMRGGLADAPLVIDRDWKTWSRFEP